MIPVTAAASYVGKSSQALKQYEDTGLLGLPVFDPIAGCMCYSTDQFRRLLFILALEDLGLTRDQVAYRLQEGISLQELDQMLSVQRAESEWRIDSTRASLELLEARLQLASNEPPALADAVVLKLLNTQLVVSVKQPVSTPRDIRSLFKRLYDCLATQKALPTGSPTLIYLDRSYQRRRALVEAAIPVEEMLTTEPPVVTRYLASVPHCASVVHRGSHNAIVTAYASVMAWLETNRYHLSGPIREVYLAGVVWRGSSISNVTEVQFPVEEVDG